MDFAHAIVASSLTNAMDMTDVCLEKDADQFFFFANFDVTNHISAMFLLHFDFPFIGDQLLIWLVIFCVS